MRTETVMVLMLSVMIGTPKARRGASHFPSREAIRKSMERDGVPATHTGARDGLLGR